MFEQVSGSLDINALQQEILNYWEEQHTFEKSLSLHKGKEVVFYDGPPFPTGQPHHGTVLVSFIKDCLARYLTMRGYSVPRVWGWDCHGLPIEVQAEKELGINEKTEIEHSIGIKKFNDTCRSIVEGANDAWRTYIREMARWVDYDNAYKTMDRSYMESVLWVFKQCFDKGLIYRDYRVTPYCYRCETSLSISDTRESNSTRPRQDPSIVVRFALSGEKKDKPHYILAWTTTPWTLPSNLALAVAEHITYAWVDNGDAVYILAEAALGNYTKLFGEEQRVLRTGSGAELVGLHYEPLFPYFANQEGGENRFQVLAADFVDVEEGVGVVHLAPAFGEDDYWVCRAAGIRLVNPVDEKGRFSTEVADFAGQNVQEANPAIIRMLKEQGILLEHSTLEHNYPHCWRCDTPLIYKAMDAWYFSVEKIKDKLLETNRKINWVPETVQNGRFGKWLENARDWNISRNRYWSTPIPLWICDQCGKLRAFGSVEEIEQAAGVSIGQDIHREHLDPVVVPCECGGEAHRIPEVMDCWFESGAMPVGQNHYPFRNKQWFETHFPADFIVEYTGQIRCWFYYLHVLSVALFGEPAFKNCIVHGTILAKDGKKISKSKKNYTDPLELMHRYGTDSFRLYLFQTSALIMGDLCFEDEGVKRAMQQIVLPLWNAYTFLVTYANIDGFEPKTVEEPAAENILDQWILSRLCAVEQNITAAMDAYRIDGYIPQVIGLLDDLTNWYIRRSRPRFWARGFDADKAQAYATLYYTVVRLCQLLAPCAPLVSEEMYRKLTGEESVHLSDWPRVPGRYLRPDLMEKFDVLRLIITLGRSIRKKYRIKNRQPLALLRIVLPQGVEQTTVAGELDIILDELNIKQVDFLSDPTEISRVCYVPDFKRLGPRLGKDMKIVGNAIKQGKLEFKEDTVVVSENGRRWELEPEDVSVVYEGQEDVPVASEAGMVVGLDIRISDELRREGVARELVRHIQEMRKAAGYDVVDRIVLDISGDMPEEWTNYVCEQTLASTGSPENPDMEKEIEINDTRYRIAIRK